MLRLHFPTGDLIIDHRSALVPVRGLECLDSEDEVRRLLLLALSNPTAIDRLRRFFAQWNSEAWRVNVIKDRKLVERVAHMTVNGSLAAFVVYDQPTLNTVHLAAKLALADSAMAPGTGGPPAAASHAAVTPPAAAGAAPDAASRLSQTSPEAATERALGAFHVVSLTTELRFYQVLSRAPRYLPHAFRGDFDKLMNSPMRVTIVGVLSKWATAHALGTGFIVDSLLSMTRISLRQSEVITAADTLNQTIDHTLEAREDNDLEEAAKKFADTVTFFGVDAFTAMIAHGATRIVSSAAKGKSPGRQSFAKPKQLTSGGTPKGPVIRGERISGGEPPPPLKSPPLSTQRPPIKRYERPPASSMTNEEVRAWYHSQLDDMPNIIDKNAPLEVQAKQAHAFRNEVKLAARDAMKDREAANKLWREAPPPTWEEVVEKNQKRGFSGAELYRQIIRGSEKSNPEVDAKLKLRRKK